MAGGRTRREMMGVLALPFVVVLADTRHPALATPSCAEAAPSASCADCRAEVRMEARMRYRQCFAVVGVGNACDLCGHERDRHIVGTYRPRIVSEDHDDRST